MAIVHHTQKAGLPAGSLVYMGTREATRIGVTEIRYSADSYDAMPQSPDRITTEGDHTRWIDVDGVHDPDLLRQLGSHFGIHPLTLEDIMNPWHRPKLESFDEYQYLVVKMLRLSESDLVQEQLSLVLTSHTLLTFQEGKEGDVFDGVRDRLRAGAPRLRGSGPDYLCYSLLDAVVDQYFVILEEFGNRLEHLEDEILQHPSPDSLNAVHELKRDLLDLRRAVWPLREMLNALIREPGPFVSAETVLYLRDVYDHTIQVIDTVEIDREIVSGLIDTFMSASSNRMNEVMKVLTIISTIFIPLTFIAGVYGMNFQFMPELSSPYGYPIVWGIMLIMALGMVAYFHKKKWW